MLGFGVTGGEGVEAMIGRERVPLAGSRTGPACTGGAVNGDRPPGPGGLGFARLVSRIRNGLEFYEGLRATYGDAVYFRILHRRFCVLFDPDLIGEALVAKEALFEKGPAFKKTLIFKNPTTLTADGEDHRRLRGLVQPSFTRARLVAYAGEMISEALEVTGGWKAGERFDLVQVTREFTTGVINRTFFGRDVVVPAGLLEDTVRALRWSMALTLVPFGGRIARLPLRANRFREAVCKRMDEVIGESIDKARQAGGRDDLVAVLVGTREGDGGGGGLSDDEVRDEVYVMLLAGYESSANTLAWCFWHLRQWPRARERLEREVVAVLQGRRPEAEDYWRLEYAQAVVSEALRLTPPVYVVGRTALGECRIGRWTIPKGTTVQPMWGAAQRDELYFDDASSFRPERWLKGGSGSKYKLAYMPFGAGSRNCLGAAFAKMEIVFFLAVSAQRWRLNPVSREYPEVSSLGFYGFQDGLEVVVDERKDE